MISTSMLERAMAGIRVRRGSLIDLRFERCREGVDDVRVGTPRSGRRHHAEPELADHLLGGVRVLFRMRRIEARERETARLGFIVVAANAVLRDERRLRVGRRRRVRSNGRWFRLGCRSWQSRLSASIGAQAPDDETHGRDEQSPHPTPVQRAVLRVSVYGYFRPKPFRSLHFVVTGCHRLSERLSGRPPRLKRSRYRSSAGLLE